MKNRVRVAAAFAASAFWPAARLTPEAKKEELGTFRSAFPIADAADDGHRASRPPETGTALSVADETRGRCLPFGG